MYTRNIRLLQLACAFLLCAGLVVPASSQQASYDPASAESLRVPLYKSRLVQLDTAANRVSVGNPDIANGDYDIHWLEKYLAGTAG